MTTNNNLEESILGPQPSLADSMHPVDPNPQRLAEPLQDGAVIRAFCESCGGYPEFPMESLKKISEIGKFQVPEKPSDYFLRINSCHMCKKNIPPTASIHPIP